MMITVYMELFDKTTCCELMLWQQYFYLLDEAHSLKRQLVLINEMAGESFVIAAT